MSRPCRAFREIACVATAVLVAVCALYVARAVPAQAAVDFRYFRATGYDDHVLIEWGTAQEVDNVGFNLYRTEAPSFNDSSKIDLGFIPTQNPGQVWGADYEHTDSDIQAGTPYTYYYWLEDVNFKGVRNRHGPVPASNPAETPTSTPTATRTATRTPTATTAPPVSPTSTRTPEPTFTWTNTPGVTPTSTPTRVPGVTPSPTATAVGGVTPPSALTPPATAPATAEGTSHAVSSTPVESQPPAAGTSTVSTPPSPTAGTGMPGTDAQGGVRGWPWSGFSWPTVSAGGVLLLLSVASFLGAALLLGALVLLRRLGV